MSGKHRHPTSFCIPFSPNSDLVFVLRLADKRLIWVVVHSSVSADIADYDSSKLEDIFTKLLPWNIFHEAVSPARMHGITLFDGISPGYHQGDWLVG